MKADKEAVLTAGDVQPKSKQMTPLTITGALASCTPYDRTSKLWMEITDGITYCLAKVMMTIQMVEKESFKQLVKMLDPRYNIPCRKSFSKTSLPEMYEACSDKLETTLLSVEFSQM